jgi:hypothetical protein
MVYEVTRPSSHRINKITTMVQSIFVPPPVASGDDPTHLCESAHCRLFVRLPEKLNSRASGQENIFETLVSPSGPFDRVAQQDRHETPAASSCFPGPVIKSDFVHCEAAEATICSDARPAPSPLRHV